MLNYFIELNLCWLGFYLLYILLLSRETFFKANRFYLLATLLLGLIIPLLDFSWPQTATSYPLTEVYLKTVTVTVQNVEQGLEEVVINYTGTQALSWPLIVLGGIYGLGLCFFLGRFLIGYRRIAQLNQGGTIEDRGHYQIVYTQALHPPFTFLNRLYWSRNYPIQPEDRQKIIQHEETHIRQWHSFDVLLIEILQILLWCCPPIYGYQRSLRTVHEFLADEAVLRTTKKKQYGQLLLRQTQSGLQLALANNLIHSQLKKRILMMTRNKSGRSSAAKYLLLLPLLLILLTAFANREVIQPFLNTEKDNTTISNSDFDPEKVREKLAIQLVDYTRDDRFNVHQNFVAKYQYLCRRYADHKAEIKAIANDLIQKYKVPFQINGEEIVLTDPIENADEQVYKVVEKMPRFPGCEAEADTPDEQQCADMKMLTFIYNNIKYPKVAKEKGIEGTVVARFVINKEGAITEPTIARSIGGGCDEEVLRVVGEMPNWIPGRQNGKAVNVIFNLPIKFKMTSEDKAKAATGKVYETVDEMPRFSACESESDAELQEACAQKELLSFIYRNLKYPKAAQENNIQGKVIVQFVINSTGEITEAKIVKDIGGACGDEVLRVVGEMPNWIPGKHQGETVSVQYTLPILFRLEPDIAAKSKNQSLSLSSFKTFPNPAKDQVQVQFQTEAMPILLQIVDASGKEVFRQEMKDYDGSPYQSDMINLEKVSAGALYVVIKEMNGGKTHTSVLMMQ